MSKKLLALSMVILLTVGFACALCMSDLRGRSEIRTTVQMLDFTRQQLRQMNFRLENAQDREKAMISVVRTLEASSTQTQIEIDKSNSSIASINHGIVFAGFDLSALETCLSGVTQALDQVSVGATQGAISSLDFVSMPCAEANG